MQIYNKNIKKNIITELINKIKQKKELSNIDNSVIKEKLGFLLKQNKKYLGFLSNQESFEDIKKSKITEQIIKTIRKELRILYGAFQSKEIKKIHQYLNQLKTFKSAKQSGLNRITKPSHLSRPIKTAESLTLHRKILSLHLSSKERLSIYLRFYKDIFKMTGKPDSIIDIACGLNPFSFPYMRLGKDIEYTAIELNKKDADIINKYFKIMDIKGKTIGKDITKLSFKKFKADIAFAFKIFDLIPGKQIERIIKELKVKYIIASFSTKTLSKKKMTYPKRGWFQRMLKRLNLKYKKIEYPDERLYIIKIS